MNRLRDMLGPALGALVLHVLAGMLLAVAVRQYALPSVSSFVSPINAITFTVVSLPAAALPAGDEKDPVPSVLDSEPTGPSAQDGNPEAPVADGEAGRLTPSRPDADEANSPIPDGTGKVVPPQDPTPEPARPLSADQQVAGADRDARIAVAKGHEIRPHYPLGARLRGEEGVTVLRAHVDRYGKAVRVDVVTSSGHRALDRAAQRAVRRALFELTGAAEDCGSILLPFHFRLVD